MRDWRTLYEAALAETDVTSLERLIYNTEEAVTLRLQELVRTSPDSPELRELRSAADELLRLKVQRLGWPDPCIAKFPH